MPGLRLSYPFIWLESDSDTEDINRMLKLVYRLLLFLLITASFGYTQEITPFYTSNRNPFVQIYGLPQSEGGLLNSDGELSTRFIVEAANGFSVNSENDEAVYIDGESYRFQLNLRYGVFDRFEIGCDLPVISHQGGFLDSLIEGWHDFFGLPNADREDYPQDQLKYTYRNGGVEAVNVDEPVTGFGDMMLSLGYQLYEKRDTHLRSLALRSAIKLPTGKSEDLLGSCGTDLSLRIEGTDSKSLAAIRSTLFGSMGVLYMSDSDVLDDKRSDAAGFGTAGIGFKLSRKIDLKTQVDFHTPFYQDSALTELGDASAQLVLGGTFHLTDRFMVDLALSEDIIVDTSPDVVFHFGFTGYF